MALEQSARRLMVPVGAMEVTQALRNGEADSEARRLSRKEGKGARERARSAEASLACCWRKATGSSASETAACEGYGMRRSRATADRGTVAMPRFSVPERARRTASAGR